MLEQENRTVERWMSRLSPNSHKAYRIIFNLWLNWYSLNGGEFASMTPDELIEFQQNAVANGDRYKILDLAQDYVTSLKLRYNTKMKYYTVIRSFFLHNRAELPRDPFNISSDIPKVEGELKADEIRDIVVSSNKLYQAVFLCILQASFDQETLMFWNMNGYPSLRKQLEEGAHPIKIDLPGRKRMKHKRPYYTFIGKDAIDALRRYLPDPLPEKRKAIFLDQRRKPISKTGLSQYWIRHARILGHVHPRVSLEDGGGPHNKTGKGLHEFRDVFSSQWNLSQAKYEIGKYFMGHITDPLEYDKSFRNVDFYRKQYLLAEPYLNIMSSDRPFGKVGEDEIEKLRTRIQELEKEKKEYTGKYEDLIGRMEELSRQFRAHLEQEK